MWRKENLPIQLVGLYLGAATVKNSMKVLYKTKNRVTTWSCNPTLGHLPKENHNLKRYMYLSVHGSTTYNSQDMEAPKCPLTDGWIKMWRIHTHTHTHTHNGILLSNKKNAICSNMDGSRDYHSKWSHRKTAIMYHLHVESKKTVQWTYSQKRNRLTNIKNNLIVT